ncbi:MAG TPA: permease-like cell division protein FtsX [Burkholderiales bacterium]|nr:permease-like cell division protein FtsX [Burkholderiales bacterium]
MAAAARRVGRTSGLLGALVIGIALALPATGYALLDGLRVVAARVLLEPQVSVFLRPEAKRADADAVATALRGDARVANVRFVPREQALKELSGVQGMPEVIAALGRNPLPDAFVVHVKDGALEAFAVDARKLPAVGHVQADSAWAKRLSALAAVARVALWLLAGLLGAGLVAITFNSIGLQILTRREEIEVLKLIGATDAFIQRPFYYLGLLQGLAGGLVALALVAATLALLNGEIRPLADSYGSTFRFPHLPPADAAAILGFAGIIGWLGAYLSVRRRLREVELR